MSGAGYRQNPAHLAVQADDSGPCVSVVIPAFNQVGFLRECLESVVAQEMTDWEAIVVDDASTECDLEEVVAQLHDPRFRVIRHTQNRGEGAARNTGFASARAALVLPLDSDDKLHPEFLSVTTRALLAASLEVDCVYTDFQLFGASSEVWRNTAALTLRDMLRTQWIPGPGTLMRQTVWERAGGYSDGDVLRRGNADWDFWIGALAAGATPIHLPLPLYLYRRHHSSLSATMSSSDYRQREYIYRRHRELFDRHRAGGQFRATGYLNSARYAWVTHERTRALSLLARGFAIRGGRWPLARSAACELVSALRRRIPTQRGCKDDE